MEVHIFRPDKNSKDETFCNFITNHYKISVTVHEYNETNSIVDFLQEKKDTVLAGSVLYSEDVSVSLDTEYMNSDINKTIIKKKQGYLGGIVILDSDFPQQLSPGAIMNLYYGMLVLPII